MVMEETSRVAQQQDGSFAAGNEDVEVLLRRRVEVKKQLLALAKKDGLAFYKPHPKQDAFHRAGASYKMRFMRSGNRFGKTEMGAAEDAAWLRGERVFYPENDPARRGGIPQRPVKGLVIAQDWDMVKSLWTGEDGKIRRYLPNDLIAQQTRNHSGAIDTIRLKRGSSLKFDTVKSFMSNPMGAESQDWDFIHVDEPCPQDMYTSHARGLVDRAGCSWFTLTPLREPWINDMFFPDNPVANLSTWVETGTIDDNPYLTQEAKAAFAALLTDDEKECRLYGIPMNLVGLIYKSYSKEKHLLKKVPDGWDDFHLPPKHWPIAFLIDPHPQTPHCVTFVTISPHGTRVYFYDIFKHCSIEELAAEIRPVIAGRYVIEARMDPLGFINDPITESNMAAELAKHGVYVMKATKGLAQGILKVQGELKKENAIKFCPTARRTLWEITRYSWDEKENKPVDKDDHAMENLYRAESLELQWSERSHNFPVREIPITGNESDEFKIDLTKV